MIVLKSIDQTFSFAPRPAFSRRGSTRPSRPVQVIADKTECSSVALLLLLPASSDSMAYKKTVRLALGLIISASDHVKYM